MKKILLVDDEPDIVEFLQYNLQKEGFEVLVSYNGKEALREVEKCPDLIILDIMMPGIDGYEVYNRIRSNEKFTSIPVIFLTAKSGETDEIKSLDIGASDYIQKPISPKKLIARVKSSLRKSASEQRKSTGKKILEIGPLVIDTEKYSVTIDKKQKFFPRKEFHLLYYLASHPDKVFNRDSLLKDVWGNDVYVVDRTVDVHIRKIRTKLGEYSELIETIKGVGYRFKNPE